MWVHLRRPEWSTSVDWSKPPASDDNVINWVQCLEVNEGVRFDAALKIVLLETVCGQNRHGWNDYYCGCYRRRQRNGLWCAVPSPLYSRFGIEINSKSTAPKHCSKRSLPVTSYQISSNPVLEHAVRCWVVPGTSKLWPKTRDIYPTHRSTSQLWTNYSNVSSIRAGTRLFVIVLINRFALQHSWTPIQSSFLQWACCWSEHAATLLYLLATHHRMLH